MGTGCEASDEETPSWVCYNEDIRYVSQNQNNICHWSTVGCLLGVYQSTSCSFCILFSVTFSPFSHLSTRWKPKCFHTLDLKLSPLCCATPFTLGDLSYETVTRPR